MRPSLSSENTPRVTPTSELTETCVEHTPSGLLYFITNKLLSPNFSNIATTALPVAEGLRRGHCVRMMILLLHTVAAFSPAAPAHRRVHPCTRATCSRQRVCGALLASGGGDAGNDLGAYWDKATGFMRAFRVPRLKDDDLPEAAALSAQIELVAVKFSGVCSTTAQTTALG